MSAIFAYWYGMAFAITPWWFSTCEMPSMTLRDASFTGTFALRALRRMSSVRPSLRRLSAIMTYSMGTPERSASTTGRLPSMKVFSFFSLMSPHCSCGRALRLRGTMPPKGPPCDDRPIRPQGGRVMRALF